MADSPSVRLYIDHSEVSDDMEWNLSFEEVLGSTGKVTVTVQDRTNSWVPADRADVKAVLATGPFTGQVVFRGEILGESIDLELGLGWRKWAFTCVDYSFEFDWRLIGALDGKTWMDSSGLGIFVNIDPSAPSLRTDRLTIQNWFNEYIRVDGEAIGTDTFVGEYLEDFTTITPVYDRLSGGLEKLAAYVAGNLQSWLDPDLEFHWALIPNWQDLIGESVAASLDASADGLAGMSPSAPATLATDLGFAPYEVSDVYDPSEDPDRVGFHTLKFSFDGADMPEQVYVRGGTGYVYNSPPIDPLFGTKTVVSDPVAGAEGQYLLRITEDDTKLWHLDSDGYVSTSPDLVGTGGPWPVKWVQYPWSESRHTGHYYWKFLSGPYVGKLADNNTNTLATYGGIRVTFAPEVPGTPRIGTGGSGWVNEVTQNKNRRQAYLQAPISVTRNLRDSLGAQALYRGQYPTLRGSVQVTGYDGWRVGQLLKVSDARLPTDLNGSYFVIQRVSGTLYKETHLRKYTIDFGDGPASRYSYRPSRFGDASWPHPANQLVIAAHDLTPGPNSSQRISGQLVNAAGEPWNIAGKVCEWSFECYNAAGVLQTGQGEIKPEVSVTDAHGKAFTTLTTGAGLNLVYYVFGSVRAV